MCILCKKNADTSRIKAGTEKLNASVQNWEQSVPFI